MAEYELVTKTVRVYKKKPNYSEEQEDELIADQPWNKLKAKLWAKKHKISFRSVIAKVKQMGLEYDVESRIKPTAQQYTKGELQEMMEEILKIKFSEWLHKGATKDDMKKLLRCAENGRLRG